MPRDDQHAAALRRARRCINQARDFSCSIVTADNELLASAEGLPVHVIGTAVPGRGDDRAAPRLRRRRRVPPQRPVPRQHALRPTTRSSSPSFFEGEHVFTAVAKAHQADCGNALPTTYVPGAQDVYEEGALIFPCVRVQRDCRERRRHHPHVPAPDPRARAVVRRLPGGARRGPDRASGGSRSCARSTACDVDPRRSSPSGSTTASGAWSQAIPKLPAGELVGQLDARPVPGRPGRHPAHASR